jgi:SAM-dependent methyltransferase
MSDSASWDERYRGAEFIWSTQPNRFLPPVVDGLTPGRALDLACGEGRNAVWLATEGWDATGVDFSTTGLEKAARLAETNNVTVEWICADVTNWEPTAPFDLVAVFYLQLPEAHATDGQSGGGEVERKHSPGEPVVHVVHYSGLAA